MDVSGLLRQMIVESFMLSEDNIASGNNFYLVHQTKPSVCEQMLFVSFDFDNVFKFDKMTNEPYEEPDILHFFLTLDKDPVKDFEQINPLLNRMLVMEKYVSKYMELYKTFLSETFGSKSKVQPSDRMESLLQFVLPWVERDKLWQLSYGVTVEDFILDAERAIANLPLRYQNISAQIEAATRF